MWRGGKSPWQGERGMDPAAGELAAALAGGRGLTLTPSFFLLPPLFPPVDKKKAVSTARQGAKTNRPSKSSMRKDGPGARQARRSRRRPRA